MMRSVGVVVFVVLVGGWWVLHDRSSFDKGDLDGLVGDLVRNVPFGMPKGSTDEQLAEALRGPLERSVMAKNLTSLGLSATQITAAGLAHIAVLCATVCLLPLVRRAVRVNGDFYALASAHQRARHPHPWPPAVMAASQ